MTSITTAGNMQVHEGIVPVELLDLTTEYLSSLLHQATTGKLQVMGKTLLDPKKDSKWERGRTRQALHFGAHVRGGKAVGAEVEDVPACLLKVVELLKSAGLLQPADRHDEEENGEREHVLAVTVDFFRGGSYAPGLAATTSLLGPGSGTKAVQEAAETRRATDAKGLSGSRDGGTCRRGGGGSASDTEGQVCMLWLQPEGSVVVGSAPDLAAGAKNCPLLPHPPGGHQDGPAVPEGEEKEGTFSGMERLVAPGGSVMVWDSTDAKGMQVAVPRSCCNRILVSFQTLAAEASLEVLRNRSERERARVLAASVRRAAREAREAKATKGPIPGTPIVVADWRQEGHGEAKRDDKGSISIGSSVDEDAKTPSIEREHVQAVYDTIAPHWSHTRYKPWPKVEEFLSKLEACSLVADAGCGNGKYLGCDVAGGYMLGSDASVNLLHVCRERQPKAEVFASDCMRLPYRSGVFDAAISIAVLHHFSSEMRRLRALSELRRVLRLGGRLLVYAWAIEQEQDSRRSFATQDVLVPWHLADHHAQDTPDNDSPTDQDNDQGTGNTDQPARSPETITPSQTILPPPAAADGNGAAGPSCGDCTASGPGPCAGDGTGTNVPEQIGGSESASHEEAITGGSSGSSKVELVSAPTPSQPKHGVRLDGVAGAGGSVVYQRYCHVYVEGELEGLIERVEGLRLVESYYDRSNWCVVAERET